MAESGGRKQKKTLVATTTIMRFQINKCAYDDGGGPSNDLSLCVSLARLALRLADGCKTASPTSRAKCVFVLQVERRRRPPRRETKSRRQSSRTRTLAASSFSSLALLCRTTCNACERKITQSKPKLNLWNWLPGCPSSPSLPESREHTAQESVREVVSPGVS